MLRPLFIGLLLLTYLLGGLAPAWLLRGADSALATDAPLPYQHAAAWHARYHVEVDCWDSCNGDQGRALFNAARVKPRPAAPAPRFAGIDCHLGAVAESARPAALAPDYYPAPLTHWRRAAPTAGAPAQVAPPPEPCRTA